MKCFIISYTNGSHGVIEIT